MTEILNGVHRVSLGYVNSYIIDGDEGVTLIDTLLPKKESKIADVLKGIGRSFEDVSTILITHSHADHSGSAAAVQAASGAQLYAAEADAAAIEGRERAPSPPVPPYIVPMTWIMALLPAPPPATVDGFVGESSELALPTDLRAVDTPGHTPGHTSYLLDREGGALFVGDAARASRGGDVIRGYFNRSTPDIDASLRHMAEFEFETALFGHAAPIRSGAAGAFRKFAANLK